MTLEPPCSPSLQRKGTETGGRIQQKAQYNIEETNQQNVEGINPNNFITESRKLHKRFEKVSKTSKDYLNALKEQVRLMTELAQNFDEKNTETNFKIDCPESTNWSYCTPIKTKRESLAPNITRRPQNQMDWPPQKPIATGANFCPTHTST